MDKFNIGDRVKCIDASGTTYLNEGSIYTIRIVHSDFVYLNELIGKNYYSNRFKLEEENYEIY